MKSVSFMNVAMIPVPRMPRAPSLGVSVLRLDFLCSCLPTMSNAKSQGDYLIKFFVIPRITYLSWKSGFQGGV